MTKKSVIMPVYNGEKYVREAVESILNQTFPDFELIIIDDGSTDETPDILDTFTDRRMIRLKNDQNIGLAPSLQRALAAASGEFIARMDADDISLPQRLAMQSNYLNQHPEIGLVGTAMNQVNSKGKLISVLEQPAEHKAILWKMFFDCAVNEPTVMMRREVLAGTSSYDPAFGVAGDTELLARLVFLTRFANLPDVLYVRRLHGGSIMAKHGRTQNELSAIIRKKMIERILTGEKITPEFKQELTRKIMLVSRDQNSFKNRVIKFLRPFFSAPLRHKLKTFFDRHLTT